MYSKEWHENKAFALALFPDWEPTEATIALWDETFGNLNQQWVRDAIKAVRLNYSSKHPEIKWVLSAFHDVRKSHSASRDENDDEARRNAEAALRRDADDADHAALQALLRVPDDEIKAARKFVREALDMDQSSDDPRRWSRYYRGCVWARVQLAREGRCIDREAIAIFVGTGGSVTEACRKFSCALVNVFSACARHDVRIERDDERQLNVIIESMKVTTPGILKRVRSIARKTVNQVEGEVAEAGAST